MFCYWNSQSLYHKYKNWSLCKFVILRDGAGIRYEIDVSFSQSAGFKDMRLLHNSIVESEVDFRFLIRHVDLVHMWAWERFPVLRPTPGVMERGEPRSARWDGVNIIKVKDVRAALDSAKESFMWRPYSITSSDCMLSNLYRDDEQWVVVDSDDTESYARCLRVSWLVGSGHVEQYLPHRVAMQFGYDQDVPPCVVWPNLSPETAWRRYNRPLRGTKLYIPPRLFESDVSSRYVAWWSGFLSDVKLFTTPGCDEERSEDSIEDDDIPIAQLVSQSRKTKNSRRKGLDLDNETILNNYHGVETPSNSICMTEHVESRRFTGNPTDVEEDAVIAVRNDEVVSKAHNIVKIKEESSHGSTSESPQLDLEARIWRLEKIFEMIKAEKLVPSSGKILEA